MAKVKVTARFQILEFLDKFIDGATAESIGRAVVEESKKLIATGQSPVRGFGRLERYKDRKSYPGKLKNATPVNLNLSGAMLDGLTFRRKGSDVIEVGMLGGSAKVKEIAGYHQDGTPNMAARRFVPDADGEEWAVSIMRRIRDLYGERLAKLIRQSNKKG